MGHTYRDRGHRQHREERRQYDRAPAPPPPPHPRSERPEDKTLRSASVVVERKQFTLALRENHRGRYLRITEENNGRFNSIVVPAGDDAALEQFVEAVKALAAA